MIPKMASSCNPKTMHPCGNPSQGKNARRPEGCSVDETIAPFHGLQVSSVPFRPRSLFLVVSSSEIYRRGRVVSGLPRLQKEKGPLRSIHTAESVMQRLGNETGSKPFEAAASKLGATKGPENRAAEGSWSCSAKATRVGQGSVRLQVRMWVRI